MTESISDAAPASEPEPDIAEPPRVRSSGRRTTKDTTTKDRGTTTDYTLHDQPGFLLRVALRRHTGFFTQKMVEGLTAPQFSTLAKLREMGTCSQNYLGRLIDYDSATITGVVDRLRARGLIASRADPLDRRRRALQLTPEGERIAELAIARVAEISRDTFAPLSADEKSTLTRLLQKLAAADVEADDKTP